MKRIIYCLYSPDMKTPVYIGKSEKGILRPWEHIAEKSHNKEVNNWVKDLKERGLQPVICILDEADNEGILAAKEIFWIQRFLGEGYKLLNIAGIRVSFFKDQFNFVETDPLRYIRVFVRHKRKQLKLSQPEFAKKVGIGLRFLRELEQGSKINFNTESIQKILDMFGATLTVEINE